MTELTPPVVTLPNGERAELHLVGDAGDMRYVGMVDEGVAGFDTADGEHVSLMFMRPSDESDRRSTTSAQLVYGDHHE